jgi:hypothetical protein
VAKRPATRSHRRNNAGGNHPRGGGGPDLEIPIAEVKKLGFSNVAR